MNQEPSLINQRMRTPRAAGIAGVIFSFLYSSSLLLVWVSIPDNPLGPATAVINHLKTLSFSLRLLSFAGIAFLWFIAVVRDRIGQLEDRFFATVFLGSGLLFIAMVFIMITTSTMSLRTRILPRWMAILGYLLALVLLLSVGTIEWIPLVFPLWVLLISVHILTQNLGQSNVAA
jgi:hypothetical protein